MRAVKATDRTMAALRKADRLPTNIPGGKMRKGMYPGGFGGGAAGAEIYIARTTARTAAKTYTVDIYTGYTATGTLVVADRIATGAVMITPNLDDTEAVDQLPNGTNLAVTVRTFANPAYDPEDPEAEPATLTRYFPIEHVGLI